MSDIKKINGYDIKDDLARRQVNNMLEGYDNIIDELDEVKDKISVLEDIVDDAINSTDIIDNINLTLSNLEKTIVNIDKQVTANTLNIDNLESTLGSAAIIPPVYTEPTLTLQMLPKFVEHNALTDFQIIPTFLQNDAGDITKMEVFKNDVRLSITLGVTTYNGQIMLSHEDSVTYKVSISYKDGPIKQNSIGTDYPTGAIKAGTITENIIIKAYAPIYYGVITNDFTTSDFATFSKVVQNNKSTIQTYDLSDSKSVYAYPASFGKLTSIKDDNNFNYINSYTLQVVTYNNVTYNVYIMTDPVTISNFKQNFS